MKNFPVILAICTMICFVSCGGGNSKSSGKNNNESSSGTSVCSYGTYECRGNDSYYCGYPDSSNDLMWVFAEKCDNGCNEQTGKCNSDSDGSNNSDSGETESDDNNDSGESTIIGECTGLPENAEWNTVSSITTTWKDSGWVPPLAGTYNEKASETECRFKCISGYKWTGSKCVDPNCGPDSYTPCTDSASGLIWFSKTKIGIWDIAVSYCNNLNEGGFTDWHLPTISELRTLIQNCSGTISGGPCKVSDDCLSGTCFDNSCTGCDYDQSGTYSKFGETGFFWSSSTTSNMTNFAWGVKFDYGKIANDIKNYDSGYFVRCVRYDGKTRESYCNNLPENAEWNTVSSITQTLVGNEWTPTTAENVALNALRTTHGTDLLAQATQEKQHAIRNLKTASGTTTEQKELFNRLGMAVTGFLKAMKLFSAKLKAIRVIVYLNVIPDSIGMKIFAK